MASTPAENRLDEVWTTTALRLALTAVVATAGLAALIVLLSGSPLREPLSLARSFGLTTALILSSLGFRLLVLRIRRANDRWAWAMLVSASAVSLLLAIALPSPQTTLAPRCVLWLGLLLSEAIGWSVLVLRGDARWNALPTPMTDAAPPRPETVPTDHSPLEAGVTQRMTRYREGAVESVRVELRQAFAANQRRATAHAAFSPSLPSDPEVQCQQLDGPPATFKVTQAESFGVRLEIRLERAPAEPTEIVLQCFASAVDPQEAGEAD